MTGRPHRPHGTHAAYVRHKRNGSVPCPACVEGERAYWRSRPDKRIKKPGVGKGGNQPKSRPRKPK